MPRTTWNAPLGMGLLAAIAVVVIAALPDGTQSQGSSGIAYVNAEEVLRQTPGYAQAESTFNAEMESYRREIERLRRQLDSAGAAFDQQSVLLSPTARQERLQELRRLQQQADARTNELNTRAQQRRAELVAPLEDRIQRVIDGLRAERNLSVIFDVAAPGNTIISADPALDLTRVVIQRLSSGGR